MIGRYTKLDIDDNSPENIAAGGVLQDHEGFWHLTCPCTMRMCKLEAGHKVSVGAGGNISTGASIGYKPSGANPKNWCHWKIDDGKPTFYSDAKCAGARESRGEDI